MSARRVAPLLFLAILISTTSSWTPAAAMQPTAAAVPAADSRALRDIAYGPDPRQRFDVYLPAHMVGAPLIFFVHGGGWRRGDKAAPGLMDNKQARWTAAGAVVVSTNYRLLPDADPLQQARDVALALAAAQSTVARLGGDPDQSVLIGHSAGAHLVALLDASPQLAREAGARPWKGSILLDSAAVDVVAIMSARHPPLYDAAFGDDPAQWRASSPTQLLHAAGAPILAVCSTQRRRSCAQNEAFLQKAARLGTRTQLLREPLSHGQVNRELGDDNAYTRTVEDFIRSLGIRLGDGG